MYLDIDDISRTDNYSRLVCVVYIEQGPVLLNVNKALLNSGDAEIWDFPNEFNPYSWSLYQTKSGFQFSAIIIILVIILILVTFLLLLNRLRSRKINNNKVVILSAIERVHRLNEIQASSGLNDDDFLKAFYELIKEDAIWCNEKGEIFISSKGKQMRDRMNS